MCFFPSKSWFYHNSNKTSPENNEFTSISDLINNSRKRKSVVPTTNSSNTVGDIKGRRRDQANFYVLGVKDIECSLYRLGCTTVNCFELSKSVFDDATKAISSLDKKGKKSLQKGRTYMRALNYPLARRHFQEAYEVIISNIFELILIFCS